eukprot:SAG25_NODE_978_length_4432_cov_4.333260_2_plen_169_part_00
MVEQWGAGGSPRAVPLGTTASHVGERGSPDLGGRSSPEHLPRRHRRASADDRYSHGGAGAREMGEAAEGGKEGEGEGEEEEGEEEEEEDGSADDRFFSATAGSTLGELQRMRAQAGLEARGPGRSSAHPQPTAPSGTLSDSVSRSATTSPTPSMTHHSRPSSSRPHCV